MNIHEKINFKSYLNSITKKVNYNKRNFLCVEVSKWGIYPMYTDSENCRIYRNTLISLASDLYEINENY